MIVCTPVPLPPKIFNEFHKVYFNSPMQNWSINRLQEFFAGRACAQEALCILDQNLNDFTIQRANRGEPVWPDKYIGSITHSKVLAACVCVHATRFKGIGLDIEPIITNSKVHTLEKKVLLEIEKERIQKNEFKTLDEMDVLTLIFSAKESLYKCMYPIVNTFFGFEDAYIESIDENRAQFSIVLASQIESLKALNGTYKGYYKKLTFNDKDHVLTMIPFKF